MQITAFMQKIIVLFFIIILSGCGFQLQGEIPLSQPLHRLYLQTADPYGYLVRTLQQNLKMSHVDLVATPAEATTILIILRDVTSQDLLSVSGTQQTRQFNLHVTVDFEIADNHGRILLQPQTLSESQTITVQSNQILGSSNEANMYYQQMRRMLARGIMNRIASSEVTQILAEALHETKAPLIKP